MRPWLQNAALAAPSGFEAARISSQWPDMLEIRNAALSLRILTCAILLGIATPGAPALAQTNDDAMAQMNPDASPQQGAQGNPICIRLEGQLATIDRGAGTGDPAKDEQIRRYQEAQAKQQSELDRVTLQAKRMGCESSGFFSLFNGRSAQCGPVNNQIQQMRANLDQITTSLERLRSGGIGGADRENQRRSVMTALAQNNCGPQYAAAARGPGNFIDSLFGNNQTLPPPSAELGAPSGTFRTVCVRTCDGGYFPVSFATYQAAISGRREDLQGALPGDGSDAVHLPQSRRGHQPGGFDQRPALYVAAERIQIPHRVQRLLRLQGRRPDLVGSAEVGRRQGRGRTRRYHRHRGEREADAAARAAEGRAATAQERRSACRHRRRAGCNSRPGRYDRYRRRQGQGPHGGPDLHPAEAVGAILSHASPTQPVPPPDQVRGHASLERPTLRTRPPRRGRRVRPAFRQARAAPCHCRGSGW